MATRRNLFKGVLAGAAIAPLPLLAGTQVNPPAAPAMPCPAPPAPRWRAGIEGQRRADLGDGRYLNPIVAGDRPDPTVLRDGDDYYMTFSSFRDVPGIVVWHSTDLVNWAPLGPALRQPLGDVWAMDLCRHGDRYYIYLPANPGDRGWRIFVIWTDDIRAGRWSDPVDLGIDGCIDPGHVVGEDGRRYLFVNGIRKVRLTDDGLATDGELEPAYAPWRYPQEWITENFAPEGPKLFWREGWLYLVTAVGGTAGPVTGHMVIAARSRSVHGPWEHCPHNPLVRTRTIDEPWWSRGHATLVQGPRHDWWMVYHGYEHGYRTLGRQVLLEPVEWTADGWFRAGGGDLSQPLRKPQPASTPQDGEALSDDFSRDRLGTQWCLFQPDAGGLARIRRADGTLSLAGAGSSPADSAPLLCTVGDRSYEIEVTVDVPAGGEGGLLLFYSHKAFVGLGFTPEAVKNFQYAEEHPWARVPRPPGAGPVRVRLGNDAHVLTWRYSFDGGRSWQLHPTRMEVSGIHHNVFGGFLSLRPGLYSCGRASVRFADFRYRAI